MSETVLTGTGRVVSPHYLATAAGQKILDAGGNAVEAAVATAAALCAVYPHMTGLGGDGFWTIFTPDSGGDPGSGSDSGLPFASPGEVAGRASGKIHCIDASGKSGAAISKEKLSLAGFSSVPARGPWSCLIVAGAVSGWDKALELAAEWSDPLSLDVILEDAVTLARHGSPVSRGQAEAMRNFWPVLKEQSGFVQCFAPDGNPPHRGDIQKNPSLAESFETLIRNGLRDFYEGELAAAIAAAFVSAGIPLDAGDLAAQQARVPEPYFTDLTGARIFNCPPPCQGVSSLMILGIYDRLPWARFSGFPQIHGIVEATKQAFALRNSEVADPDCMRVDASAWLEAEILDRLAESISPARAGAWNYGAPGGDTVWFGVIDAAGRAVSVIQSVYHEFGSGVVLQDLGIAWHNRALGFTLEDGHPNCLAPGKRPFHTLNPALALFDDGRVMPYGSMGGDGQPQTQAAVFSRYAWLGYDLQEAVSAPRWLLGRAWGEQSNSLKLERDFADEVVMGLQKARHTVELVVERNSMMGHAGALVRHKDGRVEAAADPRGDGMTSAG